jgi:hypothetical protein
MITQPEIQKVAKQWNIADFEIELTQRVQPHETILLKITQ